ncbi:enoyl-CoA hydratase-related protein [Nocardioides sp. YIM 152315]|uniref:enoyl-CoA hydratase-related protein n=1 Tax=Nocardioides sp. YIM 152315 TaxID=3031760 RepID=UPI0023DB9222|nr:enoyl-CoA hydratase-related protein [Nocardioides sp. YIM 152315]MDF1604653.1 enoyl-CoA hydratase-related protein [Nocardioides sp. YIM 152315]
MTVRTELHGAVAVLTLDRPERRNALDPATVDALVAAIDATAADAAIRAVVLTGAGDRAFCAGMDLTGVGPTGPTSAPPRPGRSRYLQLLRDGGPKPIVAAVNGAAVAGGLELALACDLVVAADHARFALPEVARGLVPGAGGTLLPQRIPAALARELALTGAMFSAAWARDAGLVNRVLPASEVLPAAIELAGQVGANSPWAVRRTRGLLRSAYAGDPVALWDEIDAVTAQALSGPHAREGAAAFLERRAPVWPADG